MILSVRILLPADRRTLLLDYSCSAFRSVAAFLNCLFSFLKRVQHVRRSMLLAVLLLPARYSLLPYATRFSLFGSLILAIVLLFEADRSLLISWYILLFISTRCSWLTFCVSRRSSANYCTLQANYCLARLEFLASLQSLLLPSCRQVVGANAHFLLSRPELATRSHTSFLAARSYLFDVCCSLPVVRFSLLNSSFSTAGSFLS